MLSRKQINRIDATGREILDRVGVKITDNDLLSRLKKSGARVAPETKMVYMPQAWLEARLAEAPSRVDLFARRTGGDLSLGSGRVYFGNGGRVFQILDVARRSMRPTLLRDIAEVARLVDQLDNLHFFIIPCQAYDIAAEHYHLNDFFQAFKQTDKHVMGGCDTVEGVLQLHALASTIAGGEQELRAKPFVSVITNPISPLTIDSVTLQIIEFCTSKGLPLTCAPAPLTGTTAPITLAGALAQMHAEALAGVAMIQFFQPGAQTLYGAVPFAMDMRKMHSAMGSVETGMMSAAAVQLAHLHGLPIYASAGLSDAKEPDIQAGFEKMMTNLLVAQAGGDFIHLAAGMLDSGNAICLEQYVIDNELIGMIYRMLRGIEVTDQTLAYDCIAKVGPGGNYILEDHTVNHMMEEHFYPQFCIRTTFDVWERQGKPTIVSMASEQVNALLSNQSIKLEESCLANIKRRFPQIQAIE